ncbi:AAA family ATPase [Pseudonocardia hispaniensis]|uniref:AAA family ATPase n=1 Tax=Pseudonocardia hispaniensis TaxID=904933 RepID=A0ABW1J4N8_9PSEU
MGDLTDGDAAGLARALTRLLEDTRYRVVGGGGSPLVERVTGHVGVRLADLPNVAVSRPAWQHVNLHLGMQAYLRAYTPEAEWFGVAGAHRAHEDLVGLLAGAEQHGMYRLGAVDYATAAAGPDRTVEVVDLGFVATAAPDGSPVVVGLRGGLQMGPEPTCELRVLAADRATAGAVRDEVERLASEHDVYRGAVLTFDINEHYGNELVSFLPRPDLASTDVVLPDGVLEVIERHVVRSATRTERLLAAGQHLKRGLLLHGAPGTGKTHTVRYLLGRLRGWTVVILSGRALRLLAQATTLVRRLQPAVLVIEDVDLIAEDRGTYQSSPLLFELLNRIDGVDADADVTFLLTTNRAAELERALVDRPGRVDLAVEVPLPDAAARERLLRLYARGLALDEQHVAEVVAATEGVTASFIRELVRRAVLHTLDAEDGGGPDGRALPAALAELSGERSALTRALLGGGAATPSGPRETRRGFSAVAGAPQPGLAP